MKRPIWLVAGSLLLVTGVALPPAARADFELTGPDNRRILLKDDGTWRYMEAKDNDPAKDKIEDGTEAVLSLERKIEAGRNCRFAVRLVNNHPYEIRSLVLHYSAYRANGTLYDTVSSLASFASMRPGNELRREFEFTGIACQDIARVQVIGGDQCNMGDLNKFSGVKGQCLARVRVVESDLVRFDK